MGIRYNKHSFVKTWNLSKLSVVPNIQRRIENTKNTEYYLFGRLVRVSALNGAKKKTHQHS